MNVTQNLTLDYSIQPIDNYNGYLCASSNSETGIFTYSIDINKEIELIPILDCKPSPNLLIDCYAMSMCYVDEEKILILHDFFKKEIIFLHLNITTFRESGIHVPSLYGNCIKLDQEKKNLFALKEDSILQIFVGVNKDGYDEVITIGERKNHQIESFSPLGENKFILGIEGGEISVYEYSRLSRSRNNSNYELLSKTSLTPMFETRTYNTWDWNKKFGCITVNKEGDQILVSTFQKEKCSQRELILLDINDFGALRVLNNKDLSSVIGNQIDSGYGFLDIQHSIYNKTLIFASQMKTGNECHVYFIDSENEINLLFSFQINPQGFTCSALSVGLKYYTLTSKGKFQIYPLGFHKYALPNLNLSQLNSKINESELSNYQRSSWKKKPSENIQIMDSMDSTWKQKKKGEKYKNSFVSSEISQPESRKFLPLSEVSSSNSGVSGIGKSSNLSHPFTFSTGSFESRSTLSRMSKENHPPINVSMMKRQSRYKNNNLDSDSRQKYHNRSGKRMTFGMNESVNTMLSGKKETLTRFNTTSWNLNFYDSGVELGKIKIIFF